MHRAKSNPNVQKLLGGLELWEQGLRKEAQARLGAGFKPLSQVFDKQPLLADEWDLLKRVNNRGKLSNSAMKRSASETSLLTAGTEPQHRTGKQRVRVAADWDVFGAFGPTRAGAAPAAAPTDAGPSTSTALPGGRVHRVATADASLSGYACDEALPLSPGLGTFGSDPLGACRLLNPSHFCLSCSVIQRLTFGALAEPQARSAKVWRVTSADAALFICRPTTQSGGCSSNVLGNWKAGRRHCRPSRPCGGTHLIACLLRLGLVVLCQRLNFCAVVGAVYWCVHFFV